MSGSTNGTEPVGAELVVESQDPAALERDPVQYMAVVLNRAKGWLAEAQSIDSVRDAKAIAVGYESVIREKELAFDAQLSATELVRRCERRIGELIRQGQEDGTIAKRGSIGGNRKTDGSPTNYLLRTGDLFGHPEERAQTYAMADAPAEEFEQAIAEARDERNLSRRNVAKKVKGDDERPKPQQRSEWHHKTRHIDSNRILTALADELDAATAGLELMEPDGLDADVVEQCVKSIKRSIATINRHVRRIA